MMTSCLSMRHLILLLLRRNWNSGCRPVLWFQLLSKPLVLLFQSFKLILEDGQLSLPSFSWFSSTLAVFEESLIFLEKICLPVIFSWKDLSQRVELFVRDFFYVYRDTIDHNLVSVNSLYVITSWEQVASTAFLGAAHCLLFAPSFFDLSTGLLFCDRFLQRALLVSNASITLLACRRCLHLVCYINYY